MKAHIELTSRAFVFLEALPQNVAFGILRYMDHLSKFPEMGAPLGYRYAGFEGLRQLIYKRDFRIIYEFERDEETIYILTIQNCRQDFPKRRDLKRDVNRDEELPLE